VYIAPTKEALRDIILQTVAATERGDGVFVRYWLSSGRGNFSVSPAKCETSNFYCVVHEDEPGHRVGHPGVTTAMVNVPLKPRLLANMKSKNYLLNALVAMEAEEQGADLPRHPD
jgi:4-amino-4-deoxychorismate lyase